MYNFDYFKTHQPIPIGKGLEYSVLIPIVTIDNKDYLLYHVRALTLRRQPGEVAFPGGGRENDESFAETAIRETSEELGLSKNKIALIGAMDYIVATTGNVIRPFVARLLIDSLDELNINKGEVDSVFLVAIDELIKQKPDHQQVELESIMPENFPYHKIENGEYYDWKFGPFNVYFYTIGDKVIWGLTAKITKRFLYYLKKEAYKQNK